MDNQLDFSYNDVGLLSNFQPNLDEQCNVAYSNTSSDLSFGPTNFLKGAADMVLFPRYDDASMYAIQSATQNMATVSPQELSMNYASAPPSAVVPELTMDTPMLGNKMDPPMFPDHSPALTDNLDAITLGNALNTPMFQEYCSPTLTDNLEPPVTTSSRKRDASSMLEDRPTISRKKRGGVLKELNPDPNDHKAVMRARNTAAARRSRQKKMNEVDELKAQVMDLKAQLEASQAEVAQLKAQNQPNFSDSLF